MKIAVVHEWLVDWAGSEQVLEQILHCYPAADVFSLVDFLPSELRARIMGKHASTTFLQRMPFARSHLEWYLPFMPIAIEQLDLSSYDLIISSSHAVAKGVLTGPDQVHVSYVHSPMRYAWDMQHEYLRGTLGRGLRGLALRWILHYLRMWDARTAHGVDAFAANSKFVARRIAKTYGRQARVVYPPVDIERFETTHAKDEYYVCVSRLMPYKRVDLIIEAFKRMPDKRLIVVGYGAELHAHKRDTPTNVELLGFQPDLVVKDLLQRARALVFAAKEDFGIVAVEAQACGTPVIAHGAGGLAETVVPLGSANPTGVLFHRQTASDVIDAIERFEANLHLFDARNCRRNSERFSREEFRRNFLSFVDEHAGTNLQRQGVCASDRGVPGPSNR